MNTRRKFIKNTSASLLAASLLPLDACSETGHKKEETSDKETMNKLSNIGIQLFSLPKMLDNDFVGAIKMLSEMGYNEIEIYGPYPFSATSAHESWNAVTPALGFSGSGFFGRDVKEVKTMMDDYGMKIPSAHTDLDTLINGIDDLAEAAQVLGYEYVTLPAIPEEKRPSLDAYKELADTFNKIGENAKNAGIKFAYHNHGYGLQPVDGQVPLEIILDGTDPELVFFEMDIFWTTAGGADPVAYLEKYPNRYKMMHLKDMKEPKRFSGDGSNPAQWMELFPYMTTAGAGVLGVESIVEKAIETGVKHFFVEQDMVANPEVALKESIEFLKGV